MSIYSISCDKKNVKTEDLIWMRQNLTEHTRFYRCKFCNEWHPYENYKKNHSGNKERIMNISLDQLQDALFEDVITVEQFFEVLTDNFGLKKAKKILEKNLKMASKKKNDHGRHYDYGNNSQLHK